jgi:hypothetical protein
VKSIKKRKRGKPNGNKLCDETQGGDTVDKHSKKKKNKSVVVQDNNKIAPVGNENDVKDKLSNEAEASGYEHHPRLFRRIVFKCTPETGAKCDI